MSRKSVEADVNRKFDMRNDRRQETVLVPSNCLQ